MKYIFYSTDGFTQDANNVEIENCQILGFSDGINEKEAFDKLLKENPYLDNYIYENIYALKTVDEPILI